MHIKSIVAGTAIALAATLGSASAADQFTTLDGSALLQSPATGQFAVLDGIPAEALSAGDMAAVRGTATPLAVLAALAKQALLPPEGPGNSVPNFNGAVAGPIWIGRAACDNGNVSC